MRFLFGETIALPSVSLSALYFLLYEMFHFIYHLPLDSPVLRVKLLRWLSDHHTLHHDPIWMSKANFNIVFPLFDWVLGTYRTKT